MKRLLIILIVVLFCIPAMAQFPLPPYVRAGTLVQSQDYRLQTLLSFKMPVAQDTTLNGSVDSTGMMILRLIDTSVYVRIPSTPGINKWTRLLKLGEGGGGLPSPGVYKPSPSNGQTSFTVPYSLPANSNWISVYRNGRKLSFTRSSNTLTIQYPCAVGDQIEILWIE